MIWTCDINSTIKCDRLWDGALEKVFSRMHWLTFEKPVQSHYESQMKMMIGAEVLKRSACDAPSFKFSSFDVQSRNK